MTPRIHAYPLETLRRNLQTQAPGGLMAGVSASGLMIGGSASGLMLGV